MFLLSSCKNQTYKEIIKNGGVILDVRSPEEYIGGHIEGSINIPISDLSDRLSEIEKYKRSPIITCCASGMRSERGKSILQSNGFKEVYNGGGWSSLQAKLE